MKSKKVGLQISTATLVMFGLGASALLLTAAHAAPTEPSAEDLETYLRPVEAPQPTPNLSTPERVELGKSLFFDPRLSGSGWISCATCHNPALGWSDGLSTAIGHNMKRLNRSTPTILNTAYQSFQMWDGRHRTLEDQALGPLLDASEMAGDMEHVISELSSIPGYVKLFDAAYAGEGITNESVSKALAAFQRTVISSESPFDRWLKGVDGAMSDEAIRGFELFKGKANCAVCHSGFNFTDNGFHNIGLQNVSDMGRYNVRKVDILKGAFKTPTLRDVALTAPYMHNGAHRTIEEVIDHYDTGGFQNAGTLSPNMKPLSLTTEEKRELVEFLNSLTGDQIAVTVPPLPVK